MEVATLQALHLPPHCWHLIWVHGSKPRLLSCPQEKSKTEACVQLSFFLTTCINMGWLLLYFIAEQIANHNYQNSLYEIAAVRHPPQPEGRKQSPLQRQDALTWYNRCSPEGAPLGCPIGMLGVPEPRELVCRQEGAGVPVS